MLELLAVEALCVEPVLVELLDPVEPVLVELLVEVESEFVEVLVELLIVVSVLLT